MKSAMSATGATPWDRETVENRYARQVSAFLTNASSALPHDVSERLRVARARALESGRWAQQARAKSGINVGGGVLAVGGGSGWGWKLASVFPAVALVLGLLLIQDQNDIDQVRAAADIDAALLSDDLPPDAYADVGFAEFLRGQDR